ncbi:PTN2-like protein, partial [Mya arenaria]
MKNFASQYFLCIGVGRVTYSLDRKLLQHTIETRSKDEIEAVERNKHHLSKNRANADIPGKLPKWAKSSFRMKKRYLVAQTPLPETVIDFLTLAVQERCSCIVSFEADMDKQKNIGIYYPAANQEVLKKETFQVSCSREENKTFYAERTLTIQHKGTSTDRTIPHLQFTDWDEMENIPRSTTKFLSFLNVIDNVMKQQDDGPILVHCVNNLCSVMDASWNIFVRSTSTPTLTMTPGNFKVLSCRLSSVKREIFKDIDN